MLAISAVERKKQVGPWGSVARQPSLLSELQDPEVPCVQRMVGSAPGRTDSYLHSEKEAVSVCVCVCGGHMGVQARGLE